MEKLKTLKDIQDEHKCSDPYCCCDDSEKIRKLAIKWIKEIDKHEDEKPLWPGGKSYCEHSDTHCGAEALIDWIKHFFNITKEDLSK